MDKKSFTISLLSVLLVIVLSLVVWLYVSVSDLKQQLAQSQVMELSLKQQIVQTKQADVEQKEKDQESKFKVTFPTRGAELCFEHPYYVSWQAPVDMEAVTATLYTPNSAQIIGDYPAVNGTSGDIGYNSFEWDLTNNGGYVIAPSKVYKLTLSGSYHGHKISASTDGLFSVSYCK